MDDAFSRKQINADGSLSTEFIINAEFVAMLDYYVATSLSAKGPDAERFRPYYRKQVGIYKSFDGKTEGRGDWRPQLLAILKGWQTLFPAVVRKKKSRLSGGTVAAVEPSDLGITQDDL